LEYGGQEFEVDNTVNLRITPRAMSKILYMRSREEIEISGWAVSDPKDPLLIIDFQTIKQEGGYATTEIDDDAQSDYLLAMADAGIEPERCCRIWVHTHPGKWVDPSGQDVETFERYTKGADWGVMLIVGDGTMRARMKIGKVFEGAFEIPVAVCFLAHYTGPKYKEWNVEYNRNVKKKTYRHVHSARYGYGGHEWEGWAHGD
jgi:proteasome lid subunit RPN8/RPN11